MRPFGKPSADTQAATGYDLESIEAPRVKGAPLRALANLVEKQGVGSAIRSQMLQNLGFGTFRAHASTFAPAPEPPLPTIDVDNAASAPDHALAMVSEHALSIDGTRLKDGFSFPSCVDFATAYREGTTSPSDVADRFLALQAETENRRPPLRAFLSVDSDDIRAQAQASTERIANKTPLSLLDGVPIAVKDEVDQQGHRTTGGTSFLGGRGVATVDSTVVARLRSKGALLVGKTNMHELGIGVTGLNPHHGSARNPYDPACFTGGSSSGSATAVASGLVPAAIGADGGGSIRIPASLCGLVGLKPTWSRVSEAGAIDLCWSVAHIGPMTSTALDAALLFAAIAGPDARDHHTQQRPAVDLRALASRTTSDAIADLDGLTIGIYDPWFDDADPAVVDACRSAVRELEALGAKVVPIEILNLDLFRLAHLVTIVSEMAASQATDYADHAKDYALDTRLNLALARGLTAMDYVQAQRVRAHAADAFARIFARVDVIMTPTCGGVSEPLPPDALQDGESNLRLVSKIMRFAGPANLVGLPAISMPVGYDDTGMPIGLQAMGRAFDEEGLLKIAIAADSLFARRHPRRFQSPIGIGA